MWFVKNPEWFDVIVTDNMFGDIITDLGAMVQGGMGIAAGGNINPEGASMFEPIGGSAPKYTGLGVINPLAAICAGQMMLDFLGETKAAQARKFLEHNDKVQITVLFRGREMQHQEEGRRVLDEIGLLGKDKKAMRVRRVTLFRGRGEEDVELLTNLIDRALFPAAELLELYRKRWGIEQVFQQVTETFSLSHLIGSSPKAVLLQFSFCLLLYNMMQVIKAYVAKDGRVLATAISMFYLFDDARQELLSWAYHTDGHWPGTPRDATALRQRLRELLKGVWNPIRHTKASDSKPRRKPPPPLRLHGGHTSVQRLLEGRAKLVSI